MKFLESTWPFKVKQFQYRTLDKLKAGFCVCGYQQIKGFNYFEAYSPDVLWLTVRLIFIVALILDLQSVQVDYTATFFQALLTNKVYVEMTCRFKEKGMVLKLKRNLYGLKQATQNFYVHLKTNLEKQGFVQSKLEA